MQSVVARGARSSKKRFGSAVDLFAEGQAQIQLKPGRDLHTLQGFDVVASRATLALDLGRFTAASAIAECALRLLHDEAAPAVYGVLLDGFDQLAAAASGDTGSVTLGALWRLIGEVGFRPAVNHCAECHIPLEDEADARFQVAAGGALCAACARQVPGGRLLPAAARRALQRWLAGEAVMVETAAVRAHQRLLREFLDHHLPDNRPLKAYRVWEQGQW